MVKLIAAGCDQLQCGNSCLPECHAVGSSSSIFAGDALNSSKARCDKLQYSDLRMQQGEREGDGYGICGGGVSLAD